MAPATLVRHESVFIWAASPRLDRYPSSISTAGTSGATSTARLALRCGLRARRSVTCPMLLRALVANSEDLLRVSRCARPIRIGATDILARSPHRSASLAVLVAPDVPAVLIELGYLSNRGDAAQMNTDSWRTKVADAIADAVDAQFTRAPPSQAAR